MKIGVILQISLFVLAVLLAMIQLWAAPWSMEIFIKLEITIGAILVVAYIVGFVIKENRENQKNQSED